MSNSNSNSKQEGKTFRQEGQQRFTNRGGYGRGDRPQTDYNKPSGGFGERRPGGGGFNNFGGNPQRRPYGGNSKSPIGQRRFQNRDNERRPHNSDSKREAGQRGDSNFINVHSDKPCKFYVFLVKQLYHNEKFNEVIISGVGMNIFHVIKVSEILTRFKYATITRIKTHSYQPSSAAGGPLKKVAKVVITLTKTEDFEQLYSEFEKNKPEMNERREKRYPTTRRPNYEQKKPTITEEEKPNDHDDSDKKEEETDEAKKAGKEDDIENPDSIEKKVDEVEVKIDQAQEEAIDPNREN